jgi:hypothetical protein
VRSGRALLAAALVLLGACAGAPRPGIDGASELGAGEAIVVGRVELVPPLMPEEQQLGGLGSGRYENRLYLLADERYRVLTKAPGIGDFSGRIEALTGRTFFARSSARPFFILAGVLFLNTGSYSSKAYFPGGFRVPLQPGDRAVYVGTLQYHRNEFFEITKAVVVDDYERAAAEFRKKFGAKIPLRKALLTRAK